MGKELSAEVTFKEDFSEDGEETTYSVWDMNTLTLVEFNEAFSRKVEYKDEELVSLNLYQLYRSPSPEVVRSKKLIESLHPHFQQGSVELMTVNTSICTRSGNIKRQSGVLRSLKDPLGKPVYLASYQRVTSVLNTQVEALKNVSRPHSLSNPTSISLPTYYFRPNSNAHNTDSNPEANQDSNPSTISSSLEETISRFPQMSDFLRRVSAKISSQEEVTEDQITLAMRRAKKFCRPNSLKKASKFCSADLRFRVYEGPKSKKKYKKNPVSADLCSFQDCLVTDVSQVKS